MPSPPFPRLESLCVDAYLKYLEKEAAAYVALVQTNSTMLKGEEEQAPSFVFVVFDWIIEDGF